MSKADRLTRSAKAEELRGNHSGAVAYFDQAIAISPRDGYLYGLRAQSLEPLERFEEALADWDRAISYFPDDDLLYQRRGDVNTNLERHEAAFADYDRATALNPSESIHLESRQSAWEMLSAARKAAGSPSAQGPETSPDGSQPMPAAAASHHPDEGSSGVLNERTLHEWQAGTVTVFPSTKTMYLCNCKLTTRRLVITDRKGNTQQALLGDISGVRVQGMALKRVVIATREGGFFNMDCKKETRQVVAWIQDAI